ncbi:MAG: hypothetical protein JWQ57_2491 [Mucilaginibacter sp.]|nr:hypothetical protein [Mucilaginibacter sp.]
MNKSYGNSTSSKSDTGKWFSIQRRNHFPIFPQSKVGNIIETGIYPQQKQSIITYDQMPSIRSDSNFINAKSIRTGWDDGIFRTMPGFYRHDLASTIPAGFVALSVADRERLIVSINQSDVKQMKDTVCYYAGNMHRCLYAVVPVTLSNQSADTLKYINMLCSWLDVFKSDRDNVKLLPSALMEECWKNGPAVYKVAPYQRAMFYIPVYFVTDMGKNKLFTQKAFKIGMSLYKYIEGGQLPVDIRGLTLRQETDNVIWSNEIVVR